jgi:hypothetical protein
MRVNIGRRPWSAPRCEAEDRADSQSCRALGRQRGTGPDTARRKKLGVHHDVSLLTTASRARHAPWVAARRTSGSRPQTRGAIRTMRNTSLLQHSNPTLRAQPDDVASRSFRRRGEVGSASTILMSRVSGSASTRTRSGVALLRIRCIPTFPIHQEHTTILGQPYSGLEWKVIESLRKTDQDRRPVLVFSKRDIGRQLLI